MESETSVWYPGRLCLVGEHCDWAGGASLAVPMEEGVRVSVRPGTLEDRVTVRSSLDGEVVEGAWPLAGEVAPLGGPLRFVGAALALLRERGVPVPACHLEGSSDLPTGRGFSSSAAFTLAVLDALTRVSGSAMTQQELAHAAYAVEHDLLGVACGLLDPLACAARSPVLIEWKDGSYALEAVRPAADLHLLVGSFPTPRDTSAILSALNADFGKGGPTVQVIETFAEASRAGARALVTGDLVGLGVQMNRARTAYERELESHLPELAAPGLRAACRLLDACGALGAKFSGAGGDGSVVALFRDPATAEQVAASDLSSVGVVARALTVTAAAE